MLLLPVYTGSWICMEKFNSENSSGTYRRKLNGPILIDSTNTETTTDAWQPCVRQSGRKDHQFLPLEVQGSTRRGSSKSRTVRPQRKRKVAMAGKKLGAECISLAGSWQDFRKILSNLERKTCTFQIGRSYAYLCKKPDICVLRSPPRFPLVVLTSRHLSTPSAEIPKNNHQFQKTQQPKSVAWSRLAVEMLLLPVYTRSWICMEKFNSENSSGTYRRKLNEHILIDSTNCETTTDAWQPCVRQSGRKEHQFIPLGVQGSTRSGSSKSRRVRPHASGRWLWRGRSWAQSAFPWQDHGKIFGGHCHPHLVIPLGLHYWEYSLYFDFYCRKYRIYI